MDTARLAAIGAARAPDHLDVLTEAIFIQLPPGHRRNQLIDHDLPQSLTLLGAAQRG